MNLPKAITILVAVVAAIIVGIGGYWWLQPRGPVLTDAEFDEPQISPDADGTADATTIRYTLSEPAHISIFLEDSNGTRFYFRENERRSAGTYRVLFSGVVDGFSLPGEDIPGTIERRLIPNGLYTWTISATTDDDTTIESGSLEIVDADSALPIISAFEISPTVFTPNQDGIRDRVRVNVYLEKAADLTVYLQDMADQRYVLPERETGRAPGEPGNHEFDYDGGVDQNMEPPPDGTYSVIAVAQDDEGQRLRRTGNLTIAQGGLPQVEIVPQTTGAIVFFDKVTYDDRYAVSEDHVGQKLAMPGGVSSDLTTLTMPVGDLLIFKLTVENYGATPIRTAGPFPGTVYDFKQRASTLGAYEQSGAWRVGIDCNTAISDFPWRWALGTLDDLTTVIDEETGETYYYLEPGQRAEVWGGVRLSEIMEARNPQDCWAGLIHEDVGVFQARVGARQIELIPEEAELDR